MKPKRIESWEKIREKGSWRYGLIYGSIWGLFVVAFLTVINYFTLTNKNDFSFEKLLIMVIIYLITGILLYRFLMWKINENNYQKWLASQNDKPE